MLFLLFRIGNDRYAIEATQIGEVLPLVTVKTLPGAPRGIAGAINYRGAPVPVIDLSALALGTTSPPRFSTRIVILSYPAADGAERWLGLIAEHATEMMHRNPADFVPSGITSLAAGYLGAVAPVSDGLIQRVEIAQLLPESVRNLLFAKPEGAG